MIKKTIEQQIRFARREAEWHRNGIDKTDDPQTANERQFKAEMLECITQTLEEVAQEARKSA